MAMAKIYDLTDVVEVPSRVNVSEEVILEVIREEVGKIVREHLPEIAAKIVREEIDKLKDSV